MGKHAVFHQITFRGERQVDRGGLDVRVRGVEGGEGEEGGRVREEKGEFRVDKTVVLHAISCESTRKSSGSG